MFYGLSEGLVFGHVINGSPVGDPGNLHYFDDRATVTLTSGDSICLDFYDQRDLTSGDGPADVSWVLEVTSGSGTVRLHDGLDPTYSADPTYTTNALGDHAATTGQLVVPAAVTFTDVLDSATSGPDPTLYLECIAGTVELQQVKLRVWPPGGALGAWSAPYAEAYEPGANNPSLLLSRAGSVPDSLSPSYIATGTAANGDFTGAWSDGVANLRARIDNVGPDIRISDGFYWVYSGFAMTLSLAAYVGTDLATLLATSNFDAEVRSLGIAYATDLQLLWAAPSLPGVPFQVAPDSVIYDNSGIIQTVGGLLPTAHWIHNTLTVVGAVHTVTAGVTASWSVKTQSGPDPTLINNATPSYNYEDASFDMSGATTVTPTNATETITLPAEGKAIYVAATCTTLTTDPSYIGGASGDNWSGVFGDVVAGTLEPLQWRRLWPAFRIWDPTASVTYLRNHSRTDGLGGNAPRNYNVTSVESSLRNFGYW